MNNPGLDEVQILFQVEGKSGKGSDGKAEPTGLPRARPKILGNLLEAVEVNRLAHEFDP